MGVDGWRLSGTDRLCWCRVLRGHRRIEDGLKGLNEKWRSEGGAEGEVEEGEEGEEGLTHGEVIGGEWSAGSKEETLSGGHRLVCIGYRGGGGGD